MEEIAERHLKSRKKRDRVIIVSTGSYGGSDSDDDGGSCELEDVLDENGNQIIEEDGTVK